MAKIQVSINPKNGAKTYTFMCPGCDSWHCPNDGWTFNGDVEKPTLSPSIKMTFHDGKICHSHVKDGKIIFCDDCTAHELSGKTMDLLDVGNP